MRYSFILAIVLAGCAVQPVKRPVIISKRSTEAVAQAQAVAPEDTVRLMWTINGAMTSIVYSSPDKRWWSPLMRVEGTNVVVPVTPPQWFYITAIGNDGESQPSNKIGILGKQAPGIIVTGEHAATVSDSWKAYDVPIYDGPMDMSMQVFRLKIMPKSQWQTVSEP